MKHAEVLLKIVRNQIVPLLEAAAEEERAQNTIAGEEIPGDRMLTCREAAALMRVSPSWLYSKTRAGLIPFARALPGRGVRYSLRGVQEWLAGQSGRPAA